MFGCEKPAPACAGPSRAPPGPVAARRRSPRAPHGARRPCPRRALRALARPRGADGSPRARRRSPPLPSGRVPRPRAARPPPRSARTPLQATGRARPGGAAPRRAPPAARRRGAATAPPVPSARRRGQARRGAPGPGRGRSRHLRAPPRRARPRARRAARVGGDGLDRPGVRAGALGPARRGRRFAICERSPVPKPASNSIRPPTCSGSASSMAAPRRGRCGPGSRRGGRLVRRLERVLQLDRRNQPLAEQQCAEARPRSGSALTVDGGIGTKTARLNGFRDCG